MSPHSLTNFEKQSYYENEPRFNGVYSRNNLSKGWDICNKSIRAHWIALYVNNNNVNYFDSSGVELIPKEIKKFIGNKDVVTNIYRLQTCDSIMREYFRIVFIDFILKGKSLLEYTNLFSPNDYEKNDKITFKNFQ